MRATSGLCEGVFAFEDCVSDRSASLVPWKQFTKNKRKSESVIGTLSLTLGILLAKVGSFQLHPSVNKFSND